MRGGRCRQCREYDETVCGFCSDCYCGMALEFGIDPRDRQAFRLRLNVLGMFRCGSGRGSRGAAERHERTRAERKWAERRSVGMANRLIGGKVIS